MSNVLTADEAARWREDLRKAGKRVVFTNGCFDLIHAGHVQYLQWARSQGDALIVGLNTDDSVRKIKGEGRPIMPLQERAEVLLGLRSVDAVVPFSERTPEVIIDRLAPDVHVKSSQYREEELPERDAVLQRGGKIALAPHVAGSSTTELIARIASRYCS